MAWVLAAGWAVAGHGAYTFSDSARTYMLLSLVSAKGPGTGRVVHWDFGCPHLVVDLVGGLDQLFESVGNVGSRN